MTGLTGDDGPCGPDGRRQIPSANSLPPPAAPTHDVFSEAPTIRQASRIDPVVHMVIVSTKYISTVVRLSLRSSLFPTKNATLPDH